MLEKKPEQRPATASEALTELACAAERAGALVPSGPPRLSRPSPDSEWSRERSAETADTTLQPFSTGGGVSDPDQGRDAMVRSASLAHKERARWPLWALLVVAAAAATLWLSRGWHDSSNAPSPSASARVPDPVPVPVPAAATPSSAPSAAVAPSVAAEPSARDALPPRPVKRLPGPPSARPRIPSDLESPF
jgi:hypothetical protein